MSGAEMVEGEVRGNPFRMSFYYQDVCGFELRGIYPLETKALVEAEVGVECWNT